MRFTLHNPAARLESWTKTFSRHHTQWQCRSRARYLHISATSTNVNNILPSESNSIAGAANPDAQFEVSDSPLPLLNVSLSASQNLYTRRGTLVGVGGKAENVVSTLSILEPFRRLVGGIPFLYQRMSSTSPVTVLISPKSAVASLAVVHLDGSTDWMVVGQSLLAWTGQTLSVKPTINTQMSLAHWGSSSITGRGLLALAGRGSIAQIVLESEESYIAHPSNVVAYSKNRHPPQPYRLKSSSFRLQIPSLNMSALFPDTKFFRVMRDSTTWRGLVRIYRGLRTWLRRSIWGDRLFLEFHGPATILLQTRAARLNDVLTSRDVNEIADAPAGALQKRISMEADNISRAVEEQEGASQSMKTKPLQMNTASIGPDGKVVFTKDGA